MKVPKCLVVEVGTSYGYRGSCRLYVKTECGAWQYFELFSRARKFKAGKTKIQCWKCYRKQKDIETK